jgi:hypothetical protein
MESAFLNPNIVSIERMPSAFVPESVHLEELGYWRRELFLGFAEERSYGDLWEVTFTNGTIDVWRGDEIEICLISE